MNPQPISRRNALKSSIATVAGSMVPAAVFAQNAAPEPSVGTPRALPQQQETTESAPKRAERQLIQQPTATMLGRTGEEAATWERITRELGTSLQFTSDGKATGELSDELQRIEKGFVFRAARNDSDYVWLHVEPLIDQAADLLDRGLQDRANWDEMSVKMFDLLLELKEFAELDQIHQEEERVGLYSTPAKQSLAEHAAELTYQQGEERVRAAVEKVLADYFSAPVKDKQSKASQGLAWLGGRAAYFFDNQTSKAIFRILGMEPRVRYPA